MSITNERRLAALTRVYSLCTITPLPEGADATPPGFTTQVTALKGCIDQVTQCLTTQATGLRVTTHSTRERRALRRALREQQLLPIFQAAIALEPTHPGISKHFWVPPANAREAQLVSAAISIGSEAAQPTYQPLLAAHLGADFLDRLHSALQVLATSQQTNETGRLSSVSATRGVSQGLADGRRIVQYLIAMIRSACLTLAGTDAVAAARTLRQFESAARIERVGGPSADGGSDQAAAPGGDGMMQTTQATPAVAQSHTPATVTSPSTSAQAAPASSSGTLPQTATGALPAAA